MSRQYTKVKHLVEIVRERKAAEETNRAIAESYGLTFKQIKKLVNRQNQRERLLAAGYNPATKRATEKKRTKRRRKSEQRNSAASDASGVAAKFSVKCWKEVKLKYRVIERLREKYPISDMCKVFEVSRSGYYAWRKRQNRAPKDQWLVDLIVECQRESKQTYGFRRVQLWLERHEKHVNAKAVLRIMRKYSLLSQVRRTKAYTHYMKAVHKYPNLLDRQFEQVFPNRFWVTDITHIPTPQGMRYMCTVLDLCGRVVLAWRLGNDMTASSVTNTIHNSQCTMHCNKKRSLMDLHSTVTKGRNTCCKHTLT